MLTPEPPHKQGQAISPIKVCQALVQAAIADEPRFVFSRVDLQRPGPHYAADTVRLLQAVFPMDRLVYLIGGASLRDLPNWHKPQELLEVVAYLGVIRWLDDQIDFSLLEEKLPGIQKRVCFVDAPRLEIASRQIRARISTRRPFRYYLTPQVYQMVVEQGLYKPDGEEGPQTPAAPAGL